MNEPINLQNKNEMHGNKESRIVARFKMAFIALRVLYSTS